MDPLVADEQCARLRLVEHRQRAQVVSNRLINEAATLKVQKYSVLAELEGCLAQFVCVVGRDPEWNEVSVEPGVLPAERGTGRESEPQSVTGAGGVGTQRQIPREPVDVALAQLGITSESAGGQAT